MRPSTLFPILLSALAAGRVVHPEPRPADVFAVPSVPIATASVYAYIPQAPVPSSIPAVHEELLRRQAPAAPLANPVVRDNGINPGVNPNPSPLPSAPATGRVGGISVTVQWLETHIGKPPTTTWVPVTITVTFADVPDQAPLPGKGEIGLGTLTEMAAQMQTAAAAPTNAAQLIKGMAVAAGVGLAGMIV